jgi:Holliday junction resolvase RusA-like endonuclease
MINSGKFSKYKKEAQTILTVQLRENTDTLLDISRHNFPLKLSFEFQLPVKITVFLQDKRRDATNIQKSLFDCMKGIVIDDDKYLLPRFEKIQIDAENPHVIVEI